MVYAIINTGGHQFKVYEKQILAVNRINKNCNTLIKFKVLLISDKNNQQFFIKKNKHLSSMEVIGKVLKNIRSKKITIQKFKNKTGYKKRQGHRQELSLLKIIKIKY